MKAKTLQRRRKIQGREKRRLLFERKDIGICSLLMAISAIITFISLGNMRYPTSGLYEEENQPVIMAFDQAMPFSAAVYLNGAHTDQGFEVYSFDKDNKVWELCHEETTEKPFFWSMFNLEVTAQLLMIVPTTPNLSILEMSFYSNGHYIAPVDVSPQKAAALFDEQELISYNQFFTEIMYFDEEFHALTAYEFISGTPPTELTHPPLGKSIIALGIRLFGMTPFGWRFMSALFGVLLIVPLYSLAKLMFGSRRLAFLATFVFTFDFMRFVQSRIATLDIFLVTFIICMYLFMYKYIQIRPEDRLSRNALFYLGGSGTFMGLAIAVKWSAVFAGIGLGVLFALTWYNALAHYTGSIPKEGANVRKYRKDLARTVRYCVLFFGIVPIIIYCLSYIPFARASGLSLPKSIIQNQTEIFSWHAFLTDTHEYQSSWWSWPFDIRPAQYYYHPMQDGRAGGIYTFGNPALWWGGFLALIWCLKRIIKDKDRTAGFLCIAWVAQIMPWVFISRFSFIYHYFPCVPFLALTSVYFIKTRPQSHQRRYVLIYGVLVLALFVVFYPVLCGMPISNSNYIKGLQWLPSWKF